MTRLSHSIGSLALAGVVAFAFVAAPVGLDYDFDLETKSAFAKGKGSGKSGGKGGGKSSSKSSKSSKGNKGGKGGNELDTASGKKGNAFGHEKARGNGHHKGDGLNGDENGDGGKKNLLGNLNAAHASANALEHAAAGSMVGLLAAYAEQADQMTAEEARAALGEISNKSSFDQSFNDGAGADVVDAEVVSEVNALLDVENKPDEEEESEEQ